MENKKVSEKNNDLQYGMHACGFIYGLMFTNSLEALEYWYGRGIKIFEVDIDYAGKGKYVACHNFVKDTFVKMEIENIPGQCTYEWFMKQKLYSKTTGGLTPMTLENIFEWLHRHLDAIFMIDPKIYSYNKTCELLSIINFYMNEFCLDKRSIIFETYNEDMIWATRKYKGRMQYQFCVDDEMQMGTSEKIRNWEIEKVIAFLKESGISIISYPWKCAVENLERLKRYHEEKFFIFSKTRNDILADLLKKAGVDVNLIDYLVTNEQRKELKQYREEYIMKYYDKIDTIFG